MALDAGRVPVAGSLDAKIIRACQTHEHCPLDCKFREVEDLGTVASFETSPAPVSKLQWWRRLRKEGS